MSTSRILCVHESVAVLQQLRQRLEVAGYEVLQAEDGGTALKILANVPVEGIVLSYDMLAPDGRSLRGQFQHGHPDTPMLLFSDVEEIREMPLHVFSEYVERSGSPVMSLVE